jgi:predicted CXXCH cytochrome family protein
MAAGKTPRATSGRAAVPGGRFLAIAAIAVAMLVPLAGCEDVTTAETGAVQPIAFQHKSHLDYFFSGKHREEEIRWKLGVMEVDKAPEELEQGKCAKCHRTFLGKTLPCAGCHRASQEAALRERKEVRVCVGCHREAWSGSIASIPSSNVCAACHAGDRPITDHRDEARLREYLARGEDVPWIRINTLPDHVYFSHSAHIRFGEMACKDCHEDMRKKEAPPTVARVFTMGGCVRCHEEQSGETECLACHQ